MKKTKEELEEDNKLTMIHYLGTFNMDMEALKGRPYSEVEEIYFRYFPPGGLLTTESSVVAEQKLVVSTQVEQILGTLDILQTNTVEGLPETSMTRTNQECIDEIRAFIKGTREEQQK